MFTANTMASAIEALGMSLPGTSSTVASDRSCLNKPRMPDGSNVLSDAKRAEAVQTVTACFNLLRNGIHARDVMTKAAFENAIVVLYALGGSTNGVLHLLALAREAGVELSIDEFNRIGGEVPFIGNLSPSGKYNWADVAPVGGLPAVMRMLLNAGMLNGDCLTVTGKTVAENLEGLEEPPADQVR